MLQDLLTETPNCNFGIKIVRKIAQFPNNGTHYAKNSAFQLILTSQQFDIEKKFLSLQKISLRLKNNQTNSHTEHNCWLKVFWKFWIFSGMISRKKSSPTLVLSSRDYYVFSNLVLRFEQQYCASFGSHFCKLFWYPWRFWFNKFPRFSQLFGPNFNKVVLEHWINCNSRFQKKIFSLFFVNAIDWLIHWINNKIKKTAV